jgi:hypothetical protein
MRRIDFRLAIRVRRPIKIRLAIRVRVAIRIRRVIRLTGKVRVGREKLRLIVVIPGGISHGRRIGLRPVPHVIRVTGGQRRVRSRRAAAGRRLGRRQGCSRFRRPKALQQSRATGRRWVIGCGTVQGNLLSRTVLTQVLAAWVPVAEGLVAQVRVAQIRVAQVTVTQAVVQQFLIDQAVISWPSDLMGSERWLLLISVAPAQIRRPGMTLRLLCVLRLLRAAHQFGFGGLLAVPGRAGWVAWQLIGQDRLSSRRTGNMASPCA